MIFHLDAGFLDERRIFLELADDDSVELVCLFIFFFLPSASSRSLASGNSSHLRTSVLRRAITAGGVPAGANSAHQKS